AARLRDERHERTLARGERALDRARGGGGPGEANARDARIADERRTHRLAATGQERERLGRHAGLVQKAHRERSHERRLLGGLREHGVARGECRRHLAHEDREREIPRTDAGERPAPRELDAIGLARGTRKLARLREMPPRLERVIAAEIDRLANLPEAVGERAPGLACEEREEIERARLEE